MASISNSPTVVEVLSLSDSVSTNNAVRVATGAAVGTVYVVNLIENGVNCANSIASASQDFDNGNYTPTVYNREGDVVTPASGETSSARFQRLQAQEPPDLYHVNVDEDSLVAGHREAMQAEKDRIYSERFNNGRFDTNLDFKNRYCFNSSDEIQGLKPQHTELNSPSGNVGENSTKPVVEQVAPPKYKAGIVVYACVYATLVVTLSYLRAAYFS